jgi:tight adherence protein C
MSSAPLAAGIAGGACVLALAELATGIPLPKAGTAVLRGLSWSPIARRLNGDRISVNVASALVASLAAFVVTVGMPVRVTALLVVIAAAAGFGAPNFWRERRSRRRLDEALRELPDMLDLLGVTLAAGLPPIRALSTVAAEFAGPLAREWARVAAEVELGLPRESAFAGLVERLPHDDVRAFAEALTRTHRHGAPLARVLAAQAERSRHRQAQRLREQAARAGPRIQLVVALLLVPSALLIVAAGLVAELGRAGIAGLP